MSVVFERLWFDVTYLKPGLTSPFFSEENVYWLPFARGIYRKLVESPNKESGIRKVFPWRDFFMGCVVLSQASKMVLFTNSKGRRLEIPSLKKHPLSPFRQQRKIRHETVLEIKTLAKFKTKFKCTPKRQRNACGIQHTNPVTNHVFAFQWTTYRQMHFIIKTFVA